MSATRSTSQMYISPLRSEKLSRLKNGLSFDPQEVWRVIDMAYELGRDEAIARCKEIAARVRKELDK